MTAPLPLRQRDFAGKLGAGTSTIAGAGCLLLALDNARNRLTGHDRDPLQLNRIGVERDCFVGSSALTEALAAEAGLKCGPRVNLLPAMMALAITSYLASGRLILAHVDHDSTKPKGDPEADHWVLLHTHAGQTFVYDDSATGTMGGLSTTTLSAPSGWPDNRVYTLLAFRTLSRA